MTKTWQIMSFAFLTTLCLWGLQATAEVATAIPEFPLPLHSFDQQKIANPAEAYRVESFGDMPLAIQIRGTAQGSAQLSVEGPFPEPGDNVEPGTGPVYKDFGQTSEASIVLKDPGIYRIIVRGAAGSSLVSSCTDSTLLKCYRPQITNQEFMTYLQQKGDLKKIETLVESKINDYVEDKKLNGILKVQFKAFVFLAQRPTNAVLNEALRLTHFDEVLHFPSLNISFLHELRPVTDMLKSHASPADQPLHGDIQEMVANTKVDRSNPKGSPTLPDVLSGDFPDFSMSRLQAAQSEVLSDVLSKLSSQDGSSVTLNKNGNEPENIDSPAALFDALIKSGHTITVRNERTYAAFIDFSLHGSYVKWPTWITLNDQINGSKVATPMGHSQIAWVIRGPLINTKIMFYLGDSGADFFPVLHPRPTWAGLRAAYSVSSDEDLAQVMQTIQVASTYLTRTRKEANTIAKGRFADGYGYVGVCNDSTAVIEKVTRGAVSSFPLARAASLDNAPLLHDGLDDVMKELPHDVDNPPTLHDLETRLFSTIPFPADADEAVPNPESANQLVEPFLGAELKAVTQIIE